MRSQNARVSFNRRCWAEINHIQEIYHVIWALNQNTYTQTRKNAPKVVTKWVAPGAINCDDKCVAISKLCVDSFCCTCKIDRLLKHPSNQNQRCKWHDVRTNEIKWQELDASNSCLFFWAHVTQMFSRFDTKKKSRFFLCFFLRCVIFEYIRIEMPNSQH